MEVAGLYFNLIHILHDVWLSKGNFGGRSAGRPADEVPGRGLDLRITSFNTSFVRTQTHANEAKSSGAPI